MRKKGGTVRIKISLRYRLLRNNAGSILPVFSKAHFKIRIAKIGEFYKSAVCLHFVNIRERHTVKCIIFHHGINGHILKIQLISHMDLFIKGIIPDHISRQTGAGGKTVGKCFESAFVAGLSVTALAP